MSVTTNKGLELQSTGSNSGTWGSVLNDDVITVLDLNLGGTQTTALSSTTPVTLTAGEAQNVIIRVTGVLTANITLRTPNLGFCIIDNATTGDFTVSVVYWTGAATVGSAIDCPQGYAIVVITDATNGARRGNNAPGSVFGASGPSSSAGLVPDPGSTVGTVKYLREDASFQIPPFQWLPSGRLTLESGSPVSTSNVIGATSVYYKEMVGITVPVFNGTTFQPSSITGGQMTLTLNNPNHAANTNYDVFFFLDSGTPTIGTGPPWTSATSRGTGVGTTQIGFINGIYTNTVAITARNGATTYAVAAGFATYLGTIRTSSTAGTTEDSKSNRFVSNAYNQVARAVSVTDTTNTWSYNTATWRQANASTANQVAAVFGLATSAVDLLAMTTAVGDDAIVAVGVGITSTTVNSCQVFGGRTNTTATIMGRYTGTPGVGYYYFAWLETGAGVSTTWYGDGGPPGWQPG